MDAVKTLPADTGIRRHLTARRGLTLLLAVAGGAGVVGLLVCGWLIQIDGKPLLWWLGMKVRWSPFGQRVIGQVLTNPLFFAMLAIVLALEMVIPARKNQRLFSASFFVDMLYYPLMVLGDLFILFYWLQLLHWVYDHSLWFLTIDAVRHWPRMTTALFCLFSLDFLQWFSHYVRHKVTWLWHFHTIHHSQKRMNLFTDHRFHVLEFVFDKTIVFIPLFAFNLRFMDILSITFLLPMYTRFYHGNIKTNLGLLRYILVTPQSHRIHHSNRPEHQDKNFGVIFSIWDQLFGTQHRGWNEYPDTGVDNDPFPREHTVMDAIAAPVRHFFYPFRQIARDFRR